MTRFDTIAIIDWSGGNDRGAKPKKDAIWAAVVRDGQPEPSCYLRNRAVASEWLTSLFSVETEAGRSVFAGFDFPFGYPDGFAEILTGQADPLAVWDWYAEHLQDTPNKNNRFDLAAQINIRFPGSGPFWFNGTKTDLPGLPRKGRDRTGHGMTERRLCERYAKGSFSCWQMGGAGAVGSQVMTGMAVLSRLRARFAGKVSVWPFEPLDKPIAMVEVWPSLYSASVQAEFKVGDIKDEVQVRVVAQKVLHLQETGELGENLDTVPIPARSEEGWIFGLEERPIARNAA